MLPLHIGTVSETLTLIMRPLICYAPDMTRVMRPSLSLYLCATFQALSFTDHSPEYFARIERYAKKHPNSVVAKAWNSAPIELISA